MNREIFQRVKVLTGIEPKELIKRQWVVLFGGGTILRLWVSLSLFLVTTGCFAQNNQKRQDIDFDSPTFVPTVKVGKVLENGDSIQYMEMNNVYVYPPISFSSKKQQQAYNRLVKNVKIVLPIAKEARAIMMETAEFLETLPDQKSRDAHMKLVERSIMKEYKPRMKKLTYSQGKLLIKLIYRESNSSGYELIQAFLGPVRAGFYQAFAWAFGASLKKNMTQRVSTALQNVWFLWWRQDRYSCLLS